MPVTEQPGFGASDDNHTNRFSPTEKWDGQYSAEAKASGTVAALRVLVIFGLKSATWIVSRSMRVRPTTSIWWNGLVSIVRPRCNSTLPMPWS